VLPAVQLIYIDALTSAWSVQGLYGYFSAICCRIWLRGGFPSKEDAKRIQGFTNQWGIYNKYPSFIDNEDITCMWNMKYVGRKLK
jgi:hypothetical protein